MGDTGFQTFVYKENCLIEVRSFSAATVAASSKSAMAAELMPTKIDLSLGLEPEKTCSMHHHHSA